MFVILLVAVSDKRLTSDDSDGAPSGIAPRYPRSFPSMITIVEEEEKAEEDLFPGANRALLLFDRTDETSLVRVSHNRIP
jgi:hypothetical protein